MSAVVERKAWTPERDRTLLRLVQIGMKQDRIAVALQVTTGAVATRLTRLRNPRPTDQPDGPRQAWTPERIARLRDLVVAGCDTDQIAEDLQTTRSAVFTQKVRLGLRSPSAITAFVREAIVRRHHEGWRPSRIALQVGVEIEVVAAVIAQADAEAEREAEELAVAAAKREADRRLLEAAGAREAEKREADRRLIEAAGVREAEKRRKREEAVRKAEREARLRDLPTERAALALERGKQIRRLHTAGLGALAIARAVGVSPSNVVQRVAVMKRAGLIR